MIAVSKAEVGISSDATVSRKSDVICDDAFMTTDEGVNVYVSVYMTPDVVSIDVLSSIIDAVLVSLDVAEDNVTLLVSMETDVVAMVLITPGVSADDSIKLINGVSVYMPLKAGDAETVLVGVNTMMDDDVCMYISLWEAGVSDNVSTLLVDVVG